MKTRTSLINQVLTLALSLSLAVPATSFAKDTRIELKSINTPTVTNGETPVAFIEIDSRYSSEPIYIAIAPVPAKDEAHTIQEVAKARKGSNLLLAVEGYKDPALEAALKSGYLPWINTFVLNEQTAPVLNSDQIPISLRQKIKNQIDKVTNWVKDNRGSLLISVGVASVYGGFSIMHSHSVSAGLSVFALMFSMVLLQSAFPKYWEAILDAGGHALKSLMKSAYSLFGREINKAEEHMYETGGSFGISWAINAATVASVFWLSGSLEAGLVNAAAQAFFFGLLNSYDVIDKSLQRWKSLNWLGSGLVMGLINFRILVGATVEVASFLNLPYTQITLGSLATAGLFALAVGPLVEQPAAQVLWKSKWQTKARARILRRRAVSSVNSLRNKVSDVKSSCANLLTGIKNRFRPQTQKISQNTSQTTEVQE